MDTIADHRLVRHYYVRHDSPSRCYKHNRYRRVSGDLDSFAKGRGYQWILVHCSNETATVLKWFLYGEPPTGYEKAYRHFKYFIDKHSFMINPDRALVPMVTRVMELNPAMRSRVRRASQLVTMGAIWRHRKSGYRCWTKNHPENPYHIKRHSGGQWECSCPDSNAPTLTRNSEVQVCKHLLAAMIEYRLRQETGHVDEALRKAA